MKTSIRAAFDAFRAHAFTAACGGAIIAALVAVMTLDPSSSDAPLRAFDSGLYIVATPIGNLSDITLRAKAILEAADLIAVEDSRVTGKLLHHLGIKGRMRPYHDHSSDSDRADLVAAAAHGIVALVSDAGTPLISDPGYKLVRDARAAGVPVTTAPGVSAVIAALSICGLPTDRFMFAGFLPSKAKARDDVINEFSALRATLVFYENGSRLGDCLAALARILGDREAAVARELTKKFEEVISGSLESLAAQFAEHAPKGEIVVIVGPPTMRANQEEGDFDAALIEELTRLPTAKAASEIAKRFGLEKNIVYARATELKAALKAEQKVDSE
jgi:16S rRNA (cytidine1402-2'-O)-methyltransferase